MNKKSHNSLNNIIQKDNLVVLGKYKDEFHFYLDYILKEQNKIDIKSNMIIFTSLENQNLEELLDKKTIAFINSDDKDYKNKKDSLTKYSKLEVKKFGLESLDNNAYILYKNYNDLGWDIIAKIEDKIVSYRFPFMAEELISISLGSLLCAYHLGIDIHIFADKFYKLKSFKNSGELYTIKLNSKKIYLYERCSKDNSESHEEFFKLVENMKPKKGTKLFLITSEKFLYTDTKKKEIDRQSLAKSIKDSNIDSFICIEKYYNSDTILHIQLRYLLDNVINKMNNNDIVILKGLSKDIFNFLMKNINRENIKIEKIENKNTMKNENEALKTLRTIKPSDIDDFKEAVNKAERKGWVYYFPMIYFFSLTNKREMLIEKKDDALNLFMFDQFNKSSKPRLQQYIPTLSSNLDEQQKALEKMYLFKGEKKAHIVRVDQDDVFKLKEYFNSMKFYYKRSEYMYDPSNYEDLSGKKFRNFRQNLNRMDKYDNISVVPYEMKYQEECLKLYDEWSVRQGVKYEDVTDEQYTKNTIKNFDLFSNEDLNGIVILKDETIISYVFGGEISDKVLCMYIAKSNLSYRGVQFFCAYSVFSNNKKYKLANNNEGLSKGLNEFKKQLVPVGKHKVYRARISV